MAKKTKAQKSAEAALDAAASAVKVAKKLSKTLPKKDGKKLLGLVDEAKDASTASKKKLVKTPRKVEKAAVDATARLERAAAKATATAAATANAAAKKPATKKKSADKVARKEKSTMKIVVSTSDAEPTEEAPASADLSALTVIALRDRARADGRTGYSRLTKAQLVALLSA